MTILSEVNPFYGGRTDGSLTWLKASPYPRPTIIPQHTAPPTRTYAVRGFSPPHPSHPQPAHNTQRRAWGGERERGEVGVTSVVQFVRARAPCGLLAGGRAICYNCNFFSNPPISASKKANKRRRIKRNREPPAHRGHSSAEERRNWV